MRVIATAGHVDHGKSSVVLALTGTDPDRFAEEKRRGLTIDLGFAHTVLASGAAVSFVDVPGHVRFLRNMLAGVGAVDACLFVVAATEGWKPQSEEHLRILELLGIGDGVVALTKTDLLGAGADVDEATALVELAAGEVRERVAGTFLADAPIVPVAVPAGQAAVGLDRLVAELDALVERTPAAADRGRPRVWVDRVFAARGSGTVVTGTLTGGTLSADDHVDLVPTGHRARIRGIQTLGTTVDRLGPGHRAALNLVGVDHGAIERGHAVVTVERWHVTHQVDASLRVLATLDHPVSRRGAYVVYLGSGEHAVRLRVLGPKSLAAGDSGAVRLHLPVDLPLVPGDRYVLRESGRDETVGGGEVLDVAPVLRASRARPDRRVERVVAERGWVAVDDLERLTGVAAPPSVGAWVVDPVVLAAATDDLRRRIDASGPHGIDVATLDERDRAVVASIPDVMVDVGRVRVAAAPDPLADHPVIVQLSTGGLAPPSPEGITREQLRTLQRRGVLVERDGQWFHADAVDRAAALAARMLRADPDGFTMSQFRDAAGITRKHAVPLVGELDARAITRRRGDLRIAGPRLPR